MRNKWQLYSVIFVALSLACVGCNAVGKAGSELTDSSAPVVRSTPAMDRETPQPELQLPGTLAVLSAKLKQNPRMTADELAAAGNELIKTNGYPFGLEPGSRDEGKTKYNFVDRNGKDLEFLFGVAEPGPCYSTLYLPLTKITRDEITIVQDGETYQVKRPKGYYTEEFVMVDASLKKKLKSWPAPIDSTPIGISDDGKEIYFEFGFGNGDNAMDRINKNLVTGISDDGSVRFIARDDHEINTGKDVEGYPQHSGIGYRRFTTKDKKEYIVKFSYPCT
jgi:hypothetical protein